MTKRMLIDATHAEETRVVVLDGSRLDEFDVETSTKRQIKSNIYLAKVVRVEPSLQAAFVEYGGNRHGFLAFGEIHPDYYQIPVADRQRLLAIQAEEARREEEEAERAEAEGGAHDAHDAEDDAPDAFGGDHPDGREDEFDASSAQPAAAPREGEAEDEDRLPPHDEAREDEPPEQGEADGASSAQPEAAPSEREAAGGDPPEDGPSSEAPAPAQPAAIPRDVVFAAEPDGAVRDEAPGEPAPAEPAPAEPAPAEPAPGAEPAAVEPPPGSALVAEEAAAAATEALAGVLRHEPPADLHEPEPEDDGEAANEPAADLPPVESIAGADDTTDAGGRRAQSRALRSYKIQEVIKRRQILLVQVVKEERGGKGAALTTYISLAGRYCVLMPNSPRGGGVSRKITSVADRRRLKEVTAELDLPQGMGLIVRTAGAARPKPEIMRDCEYLLRLWDDVRELTMQSMAPTLIYEEASLIKRAIRDVYSRDVDEIVVDGEEGWRAARNFMATLIPSHARKVQLWNDPSGQKLFARHQVDAQLDLMLSPTVQLKSGGYLVINQTEALVAIDVNSGRSTRERGIEETALRTNLEAADEVARQLRLRDLAGLIVIDFIDMESRRNNASVEKRLKDALKADRARIQLGTISHFGLMEMSRQRLRPSLAETSFLPCPHCSGTGLVRSTENAAIHVLRAVEEEGAKRRSAEIVVHAATSIALYLLNNKRDRLADIERRYGMRVVFAADESLIPPDIRIDRARALAPGEAPRIEAAPVTAPRDLAPPPADADEEDDEDAAEEEGEGEARAGADEARPGETAEEGEQRRRRRRRRRRGGRREDQAAGEQPRSAGDQAADAEASDAEHIEGVPERADEPDGGTEAAPAEAAADPASDPASDEERRRRRSRRGGRRRRRDDDVSPAVSAPGAEQPDLPPVYAGPTPADPFGGVAFDIFDVMDQAEQAAVNAPRPAPAPAPPEPEPVAAPEQAIAQAAEPEAEAVLDVPAEPPAAEAPDAARALNGSAEPAPAPEAAPEPSVAPPVVVDEAAAPAEKKRGWWRR